MIIVLPHLPRLASALTFLDVAAPDFAALHPGYDLGWKQSKTREVEEQMCPQQLFKLDPGGSGNGKEVRGPATLGEIVDGECEQVLDVFMTSEQGNFLAGVWTCTPGTMKLTDYPFNEMATIISGRIEITDEDTGKTQVFGPGDGLAISKGFRGTWHMPERVHKRFAAEIPSGS